MLTTLEMSDKLKCSNFKNHFKIWIQTSLVQSGACVCCRLAPPKFASLPLLTVVALAQTQRTLPRKVQQSACRHMYKQTLFGFHQFSWIFSLFNNLICVLFVYVRLFLYLSWRQCVRRTCFLDCAGKLFIKSLHLISPNSPGCLNSSHWLVWFFVRFTRSLNAWLWPVVTS